MHRLAAAAFVALSSVALTGCLDQLSYGRYYAGVKPGKLEGKLIVEWIDADKFAFVPDPHVPLTFKRSDGTAIVPGAMYTDGGTVPPALRAIKSYSPWGYAPAFIVHDWIFVMKHCKLAGYEAWDVNKAADLMSEVMKTLMEDGRYGPPNPLVLTSMDLSVRSSVAKDYWSEGTCETPSGTRSLSPQATTKSTEQSRIRYEIAF